jgi:hypothetical protein
MSLDPAISRTFSPLTHLVYTYRLGLVTRQRVVWCPHIVPDDNRDKYGQAKKKDA